MKRMCKAFCKGLFAGPVPKCAPVRSASHAARESAVEEMV